MIGVDLIQEDLFWRYVAEQNTYIQHVPDSKGKTNRYARYNDEATIKQLSDLGWPRIELRDSPSGSLQGNSTYQWDEMRREFRIISKVKENDFSDKLQVQTDCKNAALQILNYIYTSQREGTACNTIIRTFDTRSFKYDVVEYATADGSFAGVICSIGFKAGINWEELSYNPFPPYVVADADTVPVWNGTGWEFKPYSTGGGPETDPEFTDWLTNTAEVDNWNTAFSWGNHAGIYSLLGHSHSISDVTGLQDELNDLQGDIDAHANRTDNPHNVTKAQVGLSNVDNTSDMDKPVSTAQAAADTAVANAAATDATTKANAAEANAKAYADTLVVGLVDDRGNFDASGNLFPSSGGSGTAGAILKGDLWTVSVAGTLGGNAVTAGDLVRALVDTPGQTSANWAVTENNIGYVAENAANKATTMSGNTTSNVVYLSAKAVYDWAVATFQTIITAAGWGSFINSLTSKSTPVDADYITLMDSADSNNAKKLSWANLKATLKTYFDTLYSSNTKTILLSTTGNTVTGTTSESILFSGLIAANTFQSGDVAEIKYTVVRVNPGQVFTLKLYLNTTNSLSGATLIATSPSIGGSIKNYNLTRLYGLFTSATAFRLMSAAFATANDLAVSTSNGMTSATWYTTSAIYLIATVTNGANVDDTSHLFAEVKRVRL